jgi:chromosome segregation ATPase
VAPVDRLLAADPRLGPLLEALDRENGLLRKELGVLEGQLANTVGICEQILSENNELKLIVKRKNEDLTKVIETVASNEAEELSEVEEKNSLLLRENSILMTHLEEIKKQHERYSAAFRDQQQEQAQLERRAEDLKRQLTDCQARERDLSRKASLSEQAACQHSDEVHQLRQAKEALTFEHNELKNQLLILQGKGGGASQETIQRQLEQQYEPLLEEHKLLKRERGQLLREAEKLKLEKERLEDQQARMEREVGKALGDLDLTASLLQDEKTKNAALTHSLARLEAKVADLKEENSRLRA